MKKMFRDRHRERPAAASEAGVAEGLLMNRPSPNAPHPVPLPIGWGEGGLRPGAGWASSWPGIRSVRNKGLSRNLASPGRDIGLRCPPLHHCGRCLGRHGRRSAPSLPNFSPARVAGSTLLRVGHSRSVRGGTCSKGAFFAKRTHFLKTHCSDTTNLLPACYDQKAGPKERRRRLKNEAISKPYRSHVNPFWRFWKPNAALFERK